MKKLFTILFTIGLLASAKAGFQISALVTITNAPNTNGSSFSWNGDVRTGTNAITSTTFATNTTIGGIATNLYRQIVRFPFTSAYYAEWVSTNSFRVWAKNDVVVTNEIIGGFASVTLTTNNTGLVQTNIAVPAANWPVQSAATNAFTQLFRDMDNYSTARFSPSSTALANFSAKTNGTIFQPNLTLKSTTDPDSEDFEQGKIVYNSSNMHIYFANSDAVWLPLVIASDQGPFLRQDGANSMDGPLVVNSFVLTRTNNTSLANGANSAVDIAGHGYVKLSGPTGTFSIAGILGGTDGRIVVLQNSTGQTMEILNDSGLDGTATNRIYTGTASTITITNNPGIAKFIYDSEASRWIYTGGN